MSKDLLEIKNLKVLVESKEILKGINLNIKRGEIHAVMGPNGGGKSTLANVLMGHPHYKIEAGSIKIQGREINKLKPEERAKAGVFLAFQYPMEIPGVSVGSFLRAAFNSLKDEKISLQEFYKLVKERMQKLKIKEEFLERHLNEGFSGGEKKRMEVLQLSLLEPKIAILDETDSGLDIDALKTVSEGINQLKSKEMGILLITHYQRILKYIKPNFVHVLMEGRMVKSGGSELAQELEEKGYERINR